MHNDDDEMTAECADCGEVHSFPVFDRDFDLALANAIQEARERDVPHPTVVMALGYALFAMTGGMMHDKTTVTIKMIDGALNITVGDQENEDVYVHDRSEPNDLN